MSFYCFQIYVTVTEMTNSSGEMLVNSTSELRSVHEVHEVARLYLCPGIAGLALLGNLLAVVSIYIRDKFRIPTYAAISCLAVSDSLAVVFRLLRTLACSMCVWSYDVTSCLTGAPDRTLYDKVAAITGILAFISIHGSFCHLVLFSAIRYTIVVHPMFSHRYLTSGKILKYSGVVWMITFVISSAYTYSCIQFYEENPWFLNNFEYIDLASVLYLFLITLPPVIVLHVAKKRSIPSSLTDHVKKMNLMTIAISVITILSLLPTTLLTVLLSPETDPIEPDEIETFITVAQLTFFLGHMMHPVLYFWIHVVQKKRRNYRLHKTFCSNGQPGASTSKSCSRDSIHNTQSLLLR